MATTSTIFSLVLATGPDQVDVDAHIANNFSSLDSIVGQLHTGTGQFKASVPIPSPTLTNPVLAGTMAGGSVTATTGSFATITATGGSLTADTFSIGTFSLPATIGATNQTLSVINITSAGWLTQTGGTGAATDLGNLASVAIATNLNDFTAGVVTMARVISTSGNLTGLTSVNATTGTMSAGLTIAGTLTANVINVTGGAITAGSLAIGTYSYPATVGSTDQILVVTTGNLIFAAPTNIQGTLHDGTSIQLALNNAETTTLSTTYVEALSCTNLTMGGTVRLRADIKNDGATIFTSAQAYVNSTAVAGAVISTSGVSYVTLTTTGFPVNKGDKVQWFLKTQNAAFTASIRNQAILASFASTS